MNQIFKNAQRYKYNATCPMNISISEARQWIVKLWQVNQPPSIPPPPGSKGLIAGLIERSRYDSYCRASALKEKRLARLSHTIWGSLLKAGPCFPGRLMRRTSHRLHHQQNRFPNGSLHSVLRPNHFDQTSAQKSDGLSFRFPRLDLSLT